MTIASPRLPRPPTARPLWTLLTPMLLAACVDGYPPRQHAPLTPQEMSRAERLQVLTGISQQGAAGVKHRFQMKDDCGLQLEALPPAKPGVVSAGLQGVYLDMDFDEELEVFEIGIQPDRHHKTPRTVLLKAAAWTDASFAYKILRHQQRDCMLGGAPP